MSGSAELGSDDLEGLDALFELRDGIFGTDLLVVAVAWLDVFTWLEEHDGATFREVCAGLDIAPRPADVMCTMARAYGLLTLDLDRPRPTPLARRHLVDGAPDDLRPYLATLRDRPTVHELLTVLRTDQPPSAPTGELPPGLDLDDPTVAMRLTAPMDARGELLSERLAEVTRDVPGRRLLDIAGASGQYLAAMLAKRAGATGEIFELPPMDRVARTWVRHRAQPAITGVVAGDLLEGPLPDGFDVHLFSHILHDFDRPALAEIFTKSFASLPSGGHLLEHDCHVDAGKAGPRSAAKYGALLLLQSPRGKAWSIDELDELLVTVGFDVVGVEPTAGHRSVMIARKP